MNTLIYLSASLSLFLLCCYLLIDSLISLALKGKIKTTIDLWVNKIITYRSTRSSSLHQHQATPQSLLKQLPFYLDMLALCLEAGMNLHHAIRLTTQKAPSSLLRQAFEQLLIETRTGQAWSHAWRNMGDKLPYIETQQLVALIIQAEQFGLSLAPILHTQSEQCQQLYFARTEKQALEMPVKMIIPLILCIFPCSFIVLAFPIAYELLNSWQ